MNSDGQSQKQKHWLCSLILNLMDRYVARFRDGLTEIHAAGQEKIELATSQVKQFEAEAEMHEALGKQARAEGEAKAAMWRVRKREAGVKRRRCLFKMRRRVLEMQLENEEAMKGRKDQD